MRLAWKVSIATLGIAVTARASNYDLDVVKTSLGMPEADVARLKAQGVTTTAHLLERASTKPASRDLAKKSGVSAKMLADWVDACDLMRISGIGPDVVKVLAAVGVKNTRTLSHQKADPLSRKIEKMNAQKKLTENTPSVDHLQAWIQAAVALSSPK